MNGYAPPFLLNATHLEGIFTKMTTDYRNSWFSWWPKSFQHFSGINIGVSERSEPRSENSLRLNSGEKTGASWNSKMEYGGIPVNPLTQNWSSALPLRWIPVYLPNSNQNLGQLRIGALSKIPTVRLWKTFVDSVYSSGVVVWISGTLFISVVFFWLHINSLMGEDRSKTNSNC